MRSCYSSSGDLGLHLVRVTDEVQVALDQKVLLGVVAGSFLAGESFTSAGLDTRNFPVYMVSPMNGAQQTRNTWIGNRIRAARKRQGMSQRRLAELIAERAGIEPETARRSLVNNETGKYAPRLRTLEVIAEITEQPLDFFLGSPEVDAPSTRFPEPEAAA